MRRLYERLLFADLARQNESTSAAPRETCDKSKGAGCDLGRGRRLARNHHWRIDSRTQTLISKQSRRQSTTNLPAALSKPVSLGACCLGRVLLPTAISLSTSISLVFPRLSLTLQPSASSDSKAGRFDQTQTTPSSQVQFNRKRTGSDLHTLAFLT